jgi:uncharacterized protein
MKRYILLLIAFAMLLPLIGHAKAYKVEEVPMVHLQDSTKYVCNPDNILSSSTVLSIDTMLFSLERATGIEVVVAVVSDIEDGDCYQFALDLGKKYGVGKKKKDNGLIVLLSTEQRCIQILTGYGLEGVLPDAICKRIQEQHMNPYFAKGKWDKGMLEGMKAIRERLDGYNEEEAESLDIGGGILEAIGGLVLYLGLIGGIAWAILWFACLRPKRCPKCKERALKRISSELVFRKGGKQRHHVVYTCKKCGHTEERDEDTHYSTSSSSSGSSSRSSGGSFGGGHFGGGGAGSKF